MTVRHVENEREMESSCEYNDKIYIILGKLQEISYQFQPSNNFNTMLKSPNAPLPTYSSKEEENLIKFFHQFEETTNRFSYSDYDMFLLLKQQVSGRAGSLLEALDVSEHSYSIAKSLLLKALASPDTQKFNVIKQMSNLRLDYSSEPFEYIGQINSIHESIKSLSITVEDVLRYFCWTGMNDSFRTQMINITCENKPSLNLIKSKFFEACERYTNIQSRYNNKKTRKLGNIESLASNIEFQKKSNSNVFKVCTLCSENNDHPVFKCPAFPDAKSKVERLSNLNGCANCAKLNHQSDNCKFYFNKRCMCGKWHFSFLCVSPPVRYEEKKGSHKTDKIKKEGNGKKNEEKCKNQKEETTSGLIGVENFHVNCGREAILPTFSAAISGDVVIRVLRDSGCQSNFILESIADELNLPVVKPIALTVNGFNTSKIYNTKIVKLNLQINGKNFSLLAICTPSINTNLRLKGLSKVAEAFKEKGYKLADSQLEDCIKDVSFILGTNSSYCLNEFQINFGNELEGTEPSTFSLTPAGVMLMGNVQLMLKNMKYLPLYSNLKTSATPLWENEDTVVSSFSNFILKNSLSTDDLIEETSYEVGNFLVTNNEDIEKYGLQRVVDEALQIEKHCHSVLNYDKIIYKEDSYINNDKLVDYVLKTTEIDNDGRLIMPLIWNPRVKHLLVRNINLSKQVLLSNFKKLSKNENKLKMVDEVFKEQVKLNIIEKIENIGLFLEENPNASFLAHMPVFRMEHESTKCRVVFLSNLGEKSQTGNSISHNQAMLSGPCLNQKLTIALFNLRFDKLLLTFDLVKAFNQIKLFENDANKLCFWWFKNVNRKDYSLVAYKNVRLAFGLVCSPTLLLLGLYKILMLDSTNDEDRLKSLKRQLYSLIYMDNGSITANNKEDLRWAYNNLKLIFQSYQMKLQQFNCNEEGILSADDNTLEETTKLLGLLWNKRQDTLSTEHVKLDNKANTKRTILKSVASNFDPYGINIPLLNRARIFLHQLQCMKDLDWDEILPNEKIQEWKVICKQVNNIPIIHIPRFVGKRESNFTLICFTDSSKLIYGITVYIKDNDTGKISFIMSKNRLVNKQLETKTIPSLELHSISLGVEIMIDLFKDLSGPKCINPIKITELRLYSDSMVALCWLNACTHKLEKMNKRSTFILNRIEAICKLCEVHPIKFEFVSGIENPADKTTRAMSYKQLIKSNFFTGPIFLKTSGNEQLSRSETFQIIIPNPLAKQSDEMMVTSLAAAGKDINVEHVVKLENYSTLKKITGIYRKIFSFINKLKRRLKAKDAEKYKHIEVFSEDITVRIYNHIIYTEQRIKFPDIFEYFNSKRKLIKDIPALLNKLNLYLDQNNILRLGSKFARWKTNRTSPMFPILLSQNSILTDLIIKDYHEKYFHAGCYSLLVQLRKSFWIPHYFSAVKTILKNCIVCKRFNQRPVRINMSSYREFRAKPPEIPFKSIFMDFTGPFFVKMNNKKVKVWLLCITCLWSRAINLKICHSLTTGEFLRALQLHVFDYGVAQTCYSDLGTQLVAGGNIVSDFLRDPKTIEYLEEQGTKPVSFQHHNKGCHELGSLVEICNKLVKKLIFGAIRNNILDIRDFEFIICNTIHIVNRRPVAFLDNLRGDMDSIPDPITPEKLIHGHELASLNIIPELLNTSEVEDEFKIGPKSKIKENFTKLKKVRAKLIEDYNSEFLSTLIKQAINSKDRYKPVSHDKPKVGDIVLIKEEYYKPTNYPMGIIRSVQTNINQEVTGVKVMKGKTRGIIKRHVSTIIPLLSIEENLTSDDSRIKFDVKSHPPETNSTKLRKAAIQSREKTRIILNH